MILTTGMTLVLSLAGSIGFFVSSAGDSVASLHLAIDDTLIFLNWLVINRFLEGKRNDFNKNDMLFFG